MVARIASPTDCYVLVLCFKSAIQQTEDEEFKDIGRTCSSDIVKVRHRPHAEFVFEGVNLRLRPVREDLVEVCNHRLDVGRAVLWHELANRLKVPPVVAGKIRERCESRRLFALSDTTYRMACTTAEDAYPAQNTPGLLSTDLILETLMNEERIGTSLDHGPTRQRAFETSRSGHHPIVQVMDSPE